MNQRNERHMTTVEDDIYLTPSSGEYELVDEGQWNAVIDRIEPFMGTDFNTGEPKEQLKFIFKIQGGDWDNCIADKIVSKSLNEKATLYGIWRAVTGDVPQAGKQLGVRAALLNKPCRIIVKHKTSSRGGIFATVSDVLSPARSRRVAPPPTDDEDDDLADA